jgi:hypothetical protein
VKVQSKRTNYHLNDKEKLIKMIEDSGFTNVLAWNTSVPFCFEFDFIEFRLEK